MMTLRYVGLDVHKDSISVAVADVGDAAAQVLERLPFDEARVLKLLRTLGPLGSLKVCYEAGPTGYGLQRFLEEKGVDCVVISPSMVPQQLSRVKTDRRDAKRLAHFLRSGDLVTIWIPDAATEAIRDLVRARDDARLCERRIRQQLLKFLLRQGRRFTEGVSHWTKTHWSWIRRQTFDFEAQNQLLADAIATADQAQSRITRLNADIHDALADWRLGPLVQNLQAFCGIQELTAVGIVAEIGDFERFPTAAKFMSFVGLVPSEASSGPTRRQGGITKSGNRHVRRLLIEAAWHYYHARPNASLALLQRREGLPQEVIDIADNALRRLRKRSLKLQRIKKSATKIVTALARELAGFLWSAAITTQRLHREQTSPPATSKRAKHDRDKQQHTKREQTPLPTEL